MFPNQDPINRHVYWTDPVLQFAPPGYFNTTPHRIIGVTADIDDQHLVPEPTVTIYSTFEGGPDLLAAAFSSTPVRILIRRSRR